MRAALLPLELDAAAIDLLCDTPAAGSALTGRPLPRIGHRREVYS